MKKIAWFFAAAVSLLAADLAQAAAPKIKGVYAYLDFFVDCPAGVHLVGHRSISTGRISFSGALSYSGTAAITGVKLQFNPTATLIDSETFSYSNNATTFTASPGPNASVFHASYGNVQNGIAGTVNAIRIDAVDRGCVETIIFTKQ